MTNILMTHTLFSAVNTLRGPARHARYQRVLPVPILVAILVAVPLLHALMHVTRLPTAPGSHPHPHVGALRRHGGAAVREARGRVAGARCATASSGSS